MSATSKVTLEDLLLSLRLRLLDAIDEGNQVTLMQFKTTFTMLKEAAYGKEDKGVIGLLVHFEDAAREAAVGFRWRGDVPSVETIQAAFAEAA